MTSKRAKSCKLSPEEEEEEEYARDGRATLNVFPFTACVSPDRTLFASVPAIVVSFETIFSVIGLADLTISSAETQFLDAFTLSIVLNTTVSAENIDPVIVDFSEALSIITEVRFLPLLTAPVNPGGMRRLLSTERLGAEDAHDGRMGSMIIPIPESMVDLDQAFVDALALKDGLSTPEGAESVRKKLGIGDFDKRHRGRADCCCCRSLSF